MSDADCQRSQLAALVGALLVAACGSPTIDATSLTLRIHTTPPPDDQALSPLLDSGAVEVELRDAQTNLLFASAGANWRQSVPDQSAAPALLDLNLGLVEPFGRRDLRLSILGTSRQVLGQAVARDVAWDSGQSAEATLELRRPLALFGGGETLVPLLAPQNMAFAPISNLSAFLADARKLRILNPNSINPFLPQYEFVLDPQDAKAWVTAVAGTFDGQSILATNRSGKLHIIDTLDLHDIRSIALPDPTTRAMDIVVSADDQTAVVLTAIENSPMVGRVGQLNIYRDLTGLLRGQSNGDLFTVDINSTQTEPLLSPTAVRLSKDRKISVVFSGNPLQIGQPDCVALAGINKSKIITYDIKTGAVVKIEKAPYTTGISFTSDNERVLVQPCITVPGATRPGQIVIQRAPGDQVLPSPGVLDVVSTDNEILGIGRDDGADNPSTQALGAVYKLEKGSTKWSSSSFLLPQIRIPYRLTLDGSGNPYTSSLDIILAPTDFHVYRLVITPDRTRAVALARIQQKTRGIFVNTNGSGSSTVNCFVDYSGYTYHVFLINLQVGVPESFATVGIQNQTCGSRSFDNNNKLLGACWSPCDPADQQPFLIGYQAGYIPTAAGVMFGRQ